MPISKEGPYLKIDYEPKITFQGSLIKIDTIAKHEQPLDSMNFKLRAL